MPRNIIWPVLIGLLALSPGCASFSRPQVRDVRVRVKAIDLQGVSLVCDVDVFNPYPVALATPEFQYGMDIAEAELFASRESAKIDLPARSVGTVNLPFRVEYLKLWQMHQNLAEAAEVNYRLHGKLLVSAMQQSFELPVEHRGAFPVLRLPTFSAPNVKVGEVSVKKAGVTIDTEVSNPNVFGLGLKDIVFAVSIGDVRVGELQASLQKSLEAKGKGKLSISGEITAQKALLQLLGGKSLGKPAIECLGALDTPYGNVPLKK